MTPSFRPLHGTFGAEVVDVDPTLAVSDADFNEIEQAWYRHSILLFRNLTMTPEQHVAFTRRLGSLHIMTPLEFNLPGIPEVMVLSNAIEEGREVGLKRAGLGFHSDGEDKAVPNAGSFLHGLAVPPEGGDTLFADMYGAWDSLPDDVRAKISGKRARFSRVELHHVHYPLMPALTEQQKRDRPDVWHPISRGHPKSGRTALYIGRWAVEIEGMSVAESKPLIAYLQEFAQSPRFVYRHRWKAGDAILWDNRCAQHSATPFDDSQYVRKMYRTTLEGDVPLLAH